MNAEIPYKARLLEDIRSHTKKTLYAERFDAVLIVADYDNVVIAQIKKFRFPVRKDKVQRV